jgi:hypothetical protein
LDAFLQRAPHQTLRQFLEQSEGKSKMYSGRRESGELGREQGDTAYLRTGQKYRGEGVAKDPPQHRTMHM